MLKEDRRTKFLKGGHVLPSSPYLATLRKINMFKSSYLKNTINLSLIQRAISMIRFVTQKRLLHVIFKVCDTIMTFMNLRTSMISFSTTISANWGIFSRTFIRFVRIKLETIFALSNKNTMMKFDRLDISI